MSTPDGARTERSFFVVRGSNTWYVMSLGRSPSSGVSVFGLNPFCLSVTRTDVTYLTHHVVCGNFFVFLFLFCYAHIFES